MRKKSIKSKRAFTLVELMIAVGIVILLAALSINSLMRSKITANEAAAIKSLRTLEAALISYRVVNSRFPDANVAYAVLCNANPPYLDSNWLIDPKSEYPSNWAIRRGYRIEIKLISAGGQRYSLLAEPDKQGITGIREFMLDNSMRGGEIWDINTGTGLGSSAD